MSQSAAEQLSLFHSLIKARSFDDATLRVLASLFVSKDVKSLIEVRSSLTQLLRSESLSVIRSISGKTIQEKLLILDFFVRAFAVAGDAESCLALRYEALDMREHKSASCQWLQVSYVEWLNFVEDALHYGFHVIAEKACENALLCSGKIDFLEPGTDTFSENMKAFREITRIKNCAITSIASRSVRAQAAEYLNKKTTEKCKLDLIYEEKQCLASTSFRNGVKRKNMRKLLEHKSLSQVNGELLGQDPKDRDQHLLRTWSLRSQLLILKCPYQMHQGVVKERAQASRNAVDNSAY